MSVELVGANPMATLMVGPERHGVLSMWEVAWSLRGRGRAVLVWTNGAATVRMFSTNPDLASWLAETFNRHFPEFAGLPPIAGPVECTFTEWRLDQEQVHLEATASDGSTIACSIGSPLQTRPGYDPAMELGQVRWNLTNLLTFCEDASLEVDGIPVPGRPQTRVAEGRAHSTAFIATHETWTRGLGTRPR